MKQMVYLSGPMIGYKVKEVNSWRLEAAEKLNSETVKCLDPTRSWTETEIPKETDRWINRRDFFDCTRAQCLLVNFIGMKHLSIGTIMEIAWAYQAQIPIILIGEVDGPQKHPMLKDSITQEVRTLDEGIKLVKELLSE